MFRTPANAAYLRLLRSRHSGVPSFREFDQDLQGARRAEIAARVHAARFRGF